MAFPITISPDNAAPDAPGKYGPFSANGALYEVNLTYDSLDPDSTLRAVMMKSTDAGLTWAAVGESDLFIDARPPVHICCCQSTLDPTQIFGVWNDPSFGAATIRTFTAGPDTWSAGTPTLGSTSWACCFDAINNAVIVAYPGDQVATYGSLLHLISTVIRYDVAGDSWGVPVDLDYLDYADPTLWNQLPVGITANNDGSVTVVMAQVTSSSTKGPQIVNPGGPLWTAPGDCTLANDGFLTGGGGGADVGGGGGGGTVNFTGVAVTPGGSYSVTIGAGGIGGISATGGGSTSIFSLSAGGGDAASGGVGGAGGFGDFTGGAGGGVGAGAGGGGGGSAFIGAPGGDGGDGGIISGGTAGIGLGDGGAGGNVIPLSNGGDGDFPGGGGGGSGGAGSSSGNGSDGFIQFTYVPFTNEHDGRLWQQRVNADSSLGTLTEIPEGAFPFDNGIPPTFDYDSNTGDVAIAFSGVNDTTNAQIRVGVGPQADPVVFTFSTFAVGNMGSELDSSPAIALGTPVVAYMVAKSLTDVSFFSTAGGLIGSFADAGARIQLRRNNYGGIGTFGTPTFWTWNGVNEGGGSLTMTALAPGTQGNKITIDLFDSGIAGPAVITVTPVAGGGAHIEIAVGNDFIDWATVANQLNTSAADAYLIASGAGSGDLIRRITLGTSGFGLTTYFWVAGNNNYICMGGELLTQGNFVA